MCVIAPVYLNVTDIETYDIGHDKFCIKWSPHRAATSYRIKLHPQDRESTQPLFSSFHQFPPDHAEIFKAKLCKVVTSLNDNI